jgi:EthD protein.
MPRYRAIVMSNAREGQEDAFNRYYDEQHLPDVLAVPGYVSAERFRLVSGTDTYQYLTIYEIETDDLDAVNAEVMRRIESGEMPLTGTADPTHLFVANFEPVAQAGADGKE